MKKQIGLTTTLVFVAQIFISAQYSLASEATILRSPANINSALSLAMVEQTKAHHTYKDALKNNIQINKESDSFFEIEFIENEKLDSIEPNDQNRLYMIQVVELKN